MGYDPGYVASYETIPVVAEADLVIPENIAVSTVRGAKHNRWSNQGPGTPASKVVYHDYTLVGGRFIYAAVYDVEIVVIVARLEFGRSAA